MDAVLTDVITDSKSKIADIHNSCHIGCNKKKDCQSNCGECCAEEIIDFLIQQATDFDVT